MTSVEQESNLEFLLESVTIMGGLMVLLSSERQNRKARPPPLARRAASLEAHGGSLEHIGLQGRRSSICSKHGARQSARQAKQRKEQPSQLIDPGETADEANKMNLLQLCGPGWHTLPPETYHRTSLRRARRARSAWLQGVWWQPMAWLRHATARPPCPPEPAPPAGQVRPLLHLGGLPVLRRQDDARARQEHITGRRELLQVPDP